MLVTINAPIGGHSTFVLIPLLLPRTINSYYSLSGGLQKLKKVPNITKLATTEMPAGCGRKRSKLLPRKGQKCSLSQEFPSLSGIRSAGQEKLIITNHAPYLKPKLHQLHLKVYHTAVMHSLSMPESDSNRLQGIAAVTMSIGSAEMVDTPGHLILMNTGQLNTHSPEVTYHNMHIVVPPPPPLIRCASASPDSSPFTLAFITGNIRVCLGCRQKYSKPALPPLNLCVRHREWQEFIGPLGDPQTQYGNVYYHQAHWSQFTSLMLHNPPTCGCFQHTPNTHLGIC